MNIGIYGGTFNPIHNAHLAIAKHFTCVFNLDKCLFIPNAVSPFKIDSISSQVSDIHRINMIELAIEDEDKFGIEDFEIRNAGISYTYLTIDYLIEKYQHSNLFMLIGTDQAKSFDKWRNWQHILAKVCVCIALRPEDKREEIEDAIEGIWQLADSKPIWLDTPIIDITSTKIRNYIVDNKRISDLLPTKVEEYIHHHKLYSNI